MEDLYSPTLLSPSTSAGDWGRSESVETVGQNDRGFGGPGLFSFDAALGLMVDTIQAYGHEIQSLRHKHEQMNTMMSILE